MKIEYDTNEDVLTIEGQKYAGAMFRLMGHPTFGREGDLIQVERMPDGVLTFRCYVGLKVIPSRKPEEHEQIPFVVSR